MVQMYEDAPSFLQQLARGAGASAGQLGVGMLEGHAKNKENEFLKKLMQKNNSGNEFNESNETGNEYSMDEIYAASKIDSNLAKSMEEQNKLSQKKFEAGRKFHTERSSKFLNSVQETAEGLREREVALQSAMSAVQSGQMTPFGGDFWADLLNAPQLRTASGAELQAAAKVNLMGSLKKFGARPNQFIEKQVSDAFSKAGESAEAQMAKLKILESVLEMEKKQIDLADYLADQDREKYGYVREDIDSRVRKLMVPIAEERMQELSFDLQENKEKDLGNKKLRQDALKEVPKGTYLTPGMASILLEKVEEDEENAIKLAQELGYTIPSDELLMKKGYLQ